MLLHCLNDGITSFDAGQITNYRREAYHGVVFFNLFDMYESVGKLQGCAYYHLSFKLQDFGMGNTSVSFLWYAFPIDFTANVIVIYGRKYTQMNDL